MFVYIYIYIYMINLNRELEIFYKSFTKSDHHPRVGVRLPDDPIR